MSWLKPKRSVVAQHPLNSQPLALFVCTGCCSEKDILYHFKTFLMCLETSNHQSMCLLYCEGKGFLVIRIKHFWGLKIYLEMSSAKISHVARKHLYGQTCRQNYFPSVEASMCPCGKSCFISLNCSDMPRRFF